MAEIALRLGAVLMFVGGILLIAVILLFLANAINFFWISFSDNFRAICKAESLIFEYRKNRDEFLKWRADNGKAD